MDNIKQDAIAPSPNKSYQSKSLKIDELLKQVKNSIEEANCRISAANTLENKSEQLTKRVLGLLSVKFSLFPENENEMDRVLKEIEFCIRLISYCLIAGDVGLIEDRLISEIKKKPEAFFLSAECLTAVFNYIKDDRGLTDEARDAANEYIERAIAALNELTTSELKIPEKSEILTLEEIQEKYPQQWVMIAYTEEDEYLNVIRGEVLAYSPDCDEIEDYLPNRNGKAVAIEYTGPIPEEIGMFL